MNSMQRLGALILIAFVLCGAIPTGARATTPAQPVFVSADHISQFMNTYRQKPNAWRLPAAVQAMSDYGLLSDEESAAVHIGFIAGVLGANQMKAEKLIAAMLPLRADGQAIVIKAVAFSGLPNWKGILNDVMDRMPERKILIDRYVTGGAPLLMDMPVDQGRTLDMLWGYYLATGSYQPVQRIISALPWSNERDDLEKLVVGSMAKWTLATNAAKDQSLLELFYAESKVVPEKVAKPLKEVINAVEIAETGQIKKQAVAAIEELKIKGPASKRTIAWGTELGATALALGCVAASALGHPEVGIPCVIGGASVQAAGKIMTTDGWSMKSLGLGGLGFGGN